MSLVSDRVSGVMQNANRRSTTSSSSTAQIRCASTLVSWYCPPPLAILAYPDAKKARHNPPTADYHGSNPPINHKAPLFPSAKLTLQKPLDPDLAAGKSICVQHVKMSVSGERETPDKAGKRLQAQLDALFPSLQVRYFATARARVCACARAFVCVFVCECCWN